MVNILVRRLLKVLYGCSDEEINKGSVKVIFSRQYNAEHDITCGYGDDDPFSLSPEDLKGEDEWFEFIFSKSNTAQTEASVPATGAALVVRPSHKLRNHYVQEA